jgi:hypothetical protein
MNEFNLYFIIGVILFFTYILPSFFVKGKNKFFYILAIGCVIFYTGFPLIIGVISFFNFNTGEFVLANLLSISYIMLSPFVIIINIGLALSMFIYKKIIIKLNRAKW